MTDIVNTCVAAFCHSQNHSGSVPIPTAAIAAVATSESSFGEFELLLGSRETPRTRHRRVCGLYQHHLPASPDTTIHQLPLGKTDGCIGRLASQRGLGQELRSEVLHGDQAVVVDNPFGPHSGIVSALVDAYTGVLSGAGHGLGGPADDERCVPIAQRILVNANARRFGRQPARPDHRNTDAFRKHQSSISDRESTSRVFERQPSGFARFELGPTSALNTERLGECLGVGSQHLLLRDLRPVPQPRTARSSIGQQLAQLGVRRPFTRLLKVDGLVPEESAAVPLGHQRRLRGTARPQPKAIPDNLFHGRQPSCNHRQTKLPQAPCKEDGATAASPIRAVLAPNDQ